MFGDPNGYVTNDIDLAAALSACGKHPTLVYKPADSGKNAAFQFHRDAELLRLIEEFTADTLTISARRLLSTRRSLFHRVRELGGGR